MSARSRALAADRREEEARKCKEVDHDSKPFGEAAGSNEPSEGTSSSKAPSEREQKKRKKLPHRVEKQSTQRSPQSRFHPRTALTKRIKIKGNGPCTNFSEPFEVMFPPETVTQPFLHCNKKGSTNDTQSNGA